MYIYIYVCIHVYYQKQNIYVPASYTNKLMKNDHKSFATNFCIFQYLTIYIYTYNFKDLSVDFNLFKTWNSLKGHAKH